MNISCTCVQQTTVTKYDKFTVSENVSGGQVTCIAYAHTFLDKQVPSLDSNWKKTTTNISIWSVQSKQTRSGPPQCGSHQDLKVSIHKHISYTMHSVEKRLFTTHMRPCKASILMYDRCKV